MSDRKSVAIIGGGASGLIAAVFAAESETDVTVFERNRKTGMKLRITGKGRCNVTNNCDVNIFLRNVVNNPRFLYAALNFLTPSDTIDLFENKFKVPLKTERGNRVFPVSDNAGDVANALEAYARSVGVRFVTERISGIITDENKISGVITDPKGKRGKFDSVIIATGGVSYPKTGSDGDGYKFASECGHTIITPKPSLVPVETVRDVSMLAGLPLRNIDLTVVRTDRANKESVVFSEKGELLFTHFGLSGPLILSASAHMQDLGGEPQDSKYTALIDLKPALDEGELDRRILSDFQKYSNRDFINSLSDLLPHVLIPYITRESGIPERIKTNAVTKEQRKVFLSLLKALPFDLKKFRPVDEAIITSGGVSVKEINPKTMESKIISGLYFAGEIIDVDAYTGGYNLQIAFSTGALAGASAGVSAKM